ncbi:hypothetical protein N9060_00625, partial [Arenicella sp.]|nr:hypothetical protein [Arenicella sp.]
PDLSFYTFSADELLEILRSLPQQAANVAVVAHNPAITQVVNRLTNAELANVPTAGIVALDCPLVCWSELDDIKHDCQLRYFDYPKMLS